jgi:DNA-binding IclR family transcriptional regulator
VFASRCVDQAPARAIHDSKILNGGLFSFGRDVQLDRDGMKPATTITKVCRVLDAFRDRPSLGVTELAQETALLPSDVHRILNSLQPYGYIEQDAHSKKYHLGLHVLKLGHTVLQRLELREIGRPVLRRLSEEVEATVNMAILDARELEIIFVEQVDSPSEWRLKSRIGARAAPHCTSLGKVLMAFTDRATSRRILKKSGLPRITEHTIITAEEFERELESVRERGYGVDREEAAEGACCIAAPVRNHTGAVVAAISASMMANRFYRWREVRLATMLKTAAGRFSDSLGYDLKTERTAAAAPRVP